MASLKKLRHVAGGVVGSFTHRNNDVGGQWALGLLYRDAPENRHVMLDLMAFDAVPSTGIARTVARNYGQFLRRAAIRHGMSPDELAAARVEVWFNADLQLSWGGDYIGDPFKCVVTLTLKTGQMVAQQSVGRCLRYEQGKFGGRTPGNDAILESLQNHENT
ncbi:MAG TPA: hypothetical protein VN089_09205 [Duganella sp.]|nr:hypothetical protein [Duganella sp.]